MTSRRPAGGVLLGDQKPRVCSAPPYKSTTGAEAIELAGMAGLELDEWQQLVLTNALGEAEDGKWAAFEVGVVVSRQNGKGGLLEARELAGLFLLGERLIIHSAHQFDTSLEAFRRLLALIEGNRVLEKRVKRVLNSHGQEGIELKTGQRIRFRTRTKGGGRGFTGDCLILDEAMIIPDAMHSALLPTLSARPNPQVWYTGSAVDEDIHEHGLVFSRVRDRGLSGGDESLVYCEWSAAESLEEVTPEVADDPKAWARANPALGIRISSEYVANERRAFASNIRGFAVERLGVGVWPKLNVAAKKTIDPEKWKACLTSAELSERTAYAFDVAPDRSYSTVAAAGKLEDGTEAIEVVAHRRGTGWVVDFLAARDPDIIVCDERGPAASLITEIEKADLNLTQVNGGEYAQACGILFDAIEDGTLRQLGGDAFDAAVDVAITRPLGDAWAWSRKNSEGDISPLVAGTLALWGLQTADTTDGVWAARA